MKGNSGCLLQVPYLTDKKKGSEALWVARGGQASQRVAEMRDNPLRLGSVLHIRGFGIPDSPITGISVVSSGAQSPQKVQSRLLNKIFFPQDFLSMCILSLLLWTFFKHPYSRENYLINYHFHNLQPLVSYFFYAVHTYTFIPLLEYF